MLARMKAKMQLKSIEKYPEDGTPSQETLFFSAVGKSTAYPEDGSDEDNTFAKWTPSGELKLCITNPSLIGQFEVGQKYYLDFTPVN